MTIKTCDECKTKLESSDWCKIGAYNDGYKDGKRKVKKWKKRYKALKDLMNDMADRLERSDGFFENSDRIPTYIRAVINDIERGI